MVSMLIHALLIWLEKYSHAFPGHGKAREAWENHGLPMNSMLFPCFLHQGEHHLCRTRESLAYVYRIAMVWPLVYLWHTLGIPMLYLWHTYGISMSNSMAIGIYMAYLWCIHGVPLKRRPVMINLGRDQM